MIFLKLKQAHGVLKEWQTPVLVVSYSYILLPTTTAIDSAGKRSQHDFLSRRFNAAPVIGNNANDYDLEKGDSYVWICRKPTAFAGAFL
jgi:hypothetical protein